MQRKIINGQEIYVFGDEYTKRFVAEHKTASVWNETQLTLITETLVNFVDAMTEAFMSRGYPGTPVWLFEQVHAINKRVESLGYIYNKEDAELQKIKKPLDDYRNQMHDYFTHPMWLAKLDHDISKPVQLAMGRCYEFKLDKLQGRPCDRKQVKECHTIIDTILTAAIDSIKLSNAYHKAEKIGHLYYDLTAPMSQSTNKTTNLQIAAAAITPHNTVSHQPALATASQERNIRLQHRVTTISRQGKLNKFSFLSKRSCQPRLSQCEKIAKRQRLSSTDIAKKVSKKQRSFIPS